MEAKKKQIGKPDPRFIEFQEQFNSEGVSVGFRIPGNKFLFQYDSTGGWVDEEGKYFDKDGIPLEDGQFEDEESESESDGSEGDDDQIVDQFQQMLIEEEQGIIRSKPQKKNNPPPQNNDNKQTDIETQAKAYSQKLKNKEQVRQGLSQQIWIFFKLRSPLYQRTKPEVQKIQDLIKKNQFIKQIKDQIQVKRKQLLQSNPWLQGQFFLEYSGTSLDQGSYDRYWYGWIKVTHDKFVDTIAQINKSKQFALLKSKTFYALKSKFFLKKQMKKTITQLRASLLTIAENGAILVKINNLPEQFPLSFVLDLIELCGGYLEDVEDINIIDDFSADLIVKKRTAELFTNVQGYAHDQKQFIWLQVQDLKREIKFQDWFNVQVDAQYKVPTRQLYDTLALINSKEQLVKVYSQQEKSKFRLVANQRVIRKLLMFRGQTLNVVRIVRFQKKTEQKKVEQKKA